MRNRISVILSLALLLAGAAAAAGTRAVTFEAAFGAVRVAEDDAGLATVRLDGLPAQTPPGAPALPRRAVRLALPPDADLATVRVAVEAIGAAPIAGSFEVAPAPAVRSLDTGRADWLGAEGRIVDGRDAAIYGSAAPYPAAWGELVGAPGQLRGFKSIELLLNPVRYRPAAGALEAAGRLRVTVRYATARSTAWTRGCRIDDPLAAKLFANFADAAGWYGGECARRPAPGDAGVAVITTGEIRAESALLEEWVAMREGQGYEVYVVTDDPADAYCFDEPTGDPAEDTRADRIRKWLQDHWAGLGLGWALLIGNPDPAGNGLFPVPMKLCAKYDYETAPTDAYYADLTSDFDADGDGVYCEEEDAPAFARDIYVGRLPCYSDGAGAVDEMLARVLAYEEESLTGDLEWRRRMMLPNSIYFYQFQGCDSTMPRWDGATVGEWFIRAELAPRRLEWTALYEREGVEPSQFFSHFPVDGPHVVDQWAHGYGFVFWTGHGSNVGVYRSIWVEDANENLCADETETNYEISMPEFMTQNYTDMLAEAPPPFVVHGSCSNGYPESPENLAYNLVRRGGIASLAASRSAITWHFPQANPELWEKPEVIEGDVIDMTTDYAQNILAGAEAGRALGETIAATSNAWGIIAYYQKSLQNLYGDPLVRLVMCRSSADCDDGAYCDGLELCEGGTCVGGTPVECAPTAECAEMVCDEELDACAPGPSCASDAGTDTDAPADGGPPPAMVTGLGAGAGCAIAPRSPATAILPLFL